ncbi:MAG: helix-turn-helix domain-containing protein [Bryobacteraceae bacterium]|nr:helix-turn-helix domain-containing protein [Bryobacteraceae bacterium]
MRRQIPFFAEINDSHAAAGFPGRTDLPFFHVFTLDNNCDSVRLTMPPHRRGFYQIALLEQTPGVSVEVDANSFEAASDLLVFVAPQNVLSWVRHKTQRGFVAYFKPEFVEQSGTPLTTTFPFLRPDHINVYVVSDFIRKRLRDYFEQLCSVFESRQPYRSEILRALFTALLFESRAIDAEQGLRLSALTAGAAMAHRFLHMADQHFQSHRSVEAYAQLLDVSAKHLSEMVKEHVGRNASAVIAERIVQEARRLLTHTDLSVAEVSQHLTFSEPTHFIRFFKRWTKMTPREFRRAALAGVKRIP